MADYISKYTGSQIDGNLDKAAELPTHTNTASDGGKFLKISENDGRSLEWNKINEVPSYTQNEVGSVLTVHSTDGSSLQLIWDDATSIPTYDTISPGKFLTVYPTNNHNVLQWDDPFPTYSANEEGKFLTIASSGEGDYFYPAWSPVYPDNAQANDCLMTVYNEFDDSFSKVWRSPFPEYDSQDHEGVTALAINGQGEKEWVDIMPDHSDANENDVLKINEYGNLEWESVLPYFDYNNQGSVLTVNASGELEWNTPTIGSGEGEVLVIQDTGTPNDGAIPVYDNGHWVTKSISELISE